MEIEDVRKCNQLCDDFKEITQKIEFLKKSEIALQYFVKKDTMVGTSLNDWFDKSEVADFQNVILAKLERKKAVVKEELNKLFSMATQEIINGYKKKNKKLKVQNKALQEQVEEMKGYFTLK